MTATHRVRRGKIVEIPEEWRGRVPSNQTLLQRKRKAAEKRLSKKKRIKLEEEINFEFKDYWEEIK